MMKLRSLRTNKGIYIFILITCFFCSNVVIAQEETTEREESTTNELCEVVTTTDESEIITEQTISETGLTIPSLWWRREQLDPDEDIILDWKAHTDDKIIDLIVDRQQWNVLDYIQRYSIINDFGTVAKEYQYNLRVISDRQVCLATHNCDFTVNPDRCEIVFEFFGRRGFGR